MGSITHVIMIFSPKEKIKKEKKKKKKKKRKLIMRWKIKKQISETYKTKKSLPFSVKKRLKKVNKSIKGK